MTIKELVVVALFGLFVLLPHQAKAGSVPECGFDVNKVYQARKVGMPKEMLLEHLRKATDISEERREFILGLIERAYQTSPDEFADDAFPECDSQI